jgi:phosphoribosylanthranilate isomerase
MRVRVKLCGMTRLVDARAAVRHDADAVGFVFWKASPRRVSPAAARKIARALPPFVAKVGVFVDAPPRDVARIARQVGLDAIQLHGDEDPARYRGVGLPLMKAVSVVDRASVAAACAYPDDVTVLVDARDPVRRGGTGKLANWRLARMVASRRRILLAGGLTPANLAEAVRTVRPWGIDVSSGVEVSPGIKSEAAIARLMRTVRRMERRSED